MTLVPFAWLRRVRSLAAIASLALAVSPLAPALAFETCGPSPEEIAQKEQLRQAAFGGDAAAQERYSAIVARHATELQACRDRQWPSDQAMWLRLHPCDVTPGVLEDVLDRIANKGYNQVYVEVFYNSQVLLPEADNPTPWRSVVGAPGYENTDLLAEAIVKGRQRGMEVYAWLFTINFGYAYGIRDDRADVLARNGEGRTTLNLIDDRATADYDRETYSFAQQAFIDPYNEQARADYQQLIAEVLERQPDGVLFDYVRYPRLPGEKSVATNVRDLWIYGEGSLEALYDRVFNEAGREIVALFLERGYVTEADLERASEKKDPPAWQGRDPSQPAQRQLWHFAVAHAVQGILDFVEAAAAPVRDRGLATGAVFFPEGNRVIGQGFDSRLQPWDRFPESMEWHPMSYGVCGVPDCIVEQVQRVIEYAPDGVKIIPALAGDWGQSVLNRPSLEAQMAAIRQNAPEIDAISHFAYSWQEPESDAARQACRVN